MRKHIYTLILSALMLLTSVLAMTQGNNPVNITIMGNGQYSNLLSDYYSDQKAGMVTVTLRNADMRETQIPVQLFMSISNNMETYLQTKSPNMSRVIQLPAGEMVTLTGRDLECVFNAYYLSKNMQYLKDGQIGRAHV